MVHNNSKFDLNKRPATFCCDDGSNKNNKFDDTALRLGACGSRNSANQTHSKSAANDGCMLVVGVGPTSSLNEGDLVLKLGLSCYSSASKSDANSDSDNPSSLVEVSNEFTSNHDLDGSSTSAKSSGGYMPSLILAPRISVPLKKVRIHEPESAHDGTGFRVAHKRRVAPGSTKSVRGRGSLCVAHGITVQESKETNNGSLGITSRLFHGLVGSPDKHSLSGSSAVSNSTRRLEKPAKRRQMIPPQVLVPSSMKSSLLVPVTGQPSSGTDNNSGRESLELSVPEDRVHGGSLLSLLMGSNRSN